jgi:ribonucleoside-diphosphate reductase alpha chain
MGLHDLLLLMGYKYNSDAGLEFVDKVMGFIKNAAYQASIDLAKEKGPFPRFEAEQYLKSGFAKTLKPSLRSQIREHGIRNCALLTIAPTGTTSIVSAVTSGIEPMFSPAYLRRFRDGEELKSEVVVHPLFKQFLDEGRDVSHFQGAFDLKLRDHFEVQRTCQKHLDNACSKTINLPHDTSIEELSELYMEFFPELKGTTVYPDGSRKDQPLTPMSLDEAIKHVTGHETLQAYAQDPCRSGKCDL